LARAFPKKEMAGEQAKEELIVSAEISQSSGLIEEKESMVLKIYLGSIRSQ
jgi:hypothetical protein